MAKRTRPMSRDERYEAFKRQVQWDSWSETTRRRFDELFPEPEEPDPSITEILGMNPKDKGE